MLVGGWMPRRICFRAVDKRKHTHTHTRTFEEKQPKCTKPSRERRMRNEFCENRVFKKSQQRWWDLVFFCGFLRNVLGILRKILEVHEIFGKSVEDPWKSVENPWKFVAVGIPWAIRGSLWWKSGFCGTLRCDARGELQWANGRQAFWQCPVPTFGMCWLRILCLGHGFSWPTSCLDRLSCSMPDAAKTHPKQPPSPKFLIPMCQTMQSFNFNKVLGLIW